MEKWHLRFGITSNCNFRCSYCNSHNVYAEDMSEKDIKEILVATISNGVKRVHWTGGEPLLNKDICNYMEYAKKLGYEEQVMTTNGFFLEKKAEDLKKAGITRINVSLDTMQNEKFKSIVGVDCLENVLKGIEKILNISDCLVKINMVVMKDNISEIPEFVRYAIKQNKKYGSERVIIRFLQFFPCNPNQLEKDGQKFWVDEYITETNILNQIKEIGEIQEIEKNKIQGDNPSMKYYRVNNEVTVGNLSMFSWGYPCGNCHKLRISPQGNATICLNDEKTEKLIGTTFEEKKKIIKNMLERRENEVNKNVNRKHFRNNLGEFRFGKNEKEANIEDFYEMLRKGRGRECNI